MSVRFIYLFLTIVSLGFSQNQFTLSGTIYETEGQETLIGATIIFPELNTGTTTNEYGFYSITLEAGTYEVLVSYIGFESINLTITLNENKTLNQNGVHMCAKRYPCTIDQNV